MKRMAIRLVAACALLAARPALATFHIIVIDQLFPGLVEAPDAQFVVLRMQEPVQTAVYGQPVTAADAAGNALPNFAAFCPTQGATCSLPRVSPACAANDCSAPFNANGHAIFVATKLAEELFCVTADLVATSSLPYPDGRVCWGDCGPRADCPEGPVDCLAYGSFTGGNTIFGTSALSPTLGSALVTDPARQNQFVGGNLLDDSIGFHVGAPAAENYHGDHGSMTGVAGDADGDGNVTTMDIAAQSTAFFESDHRCDLPAERRGADANFDARVSAADLVATIGLRTI